MTKFAMTLVLGAMIALISCSEDDDPVVANPCPTFTTADSVCFCKANPTDTKCKVEVKDTCTFDLNKDCFCKANPTDTKCAASESSYMTNAILGYDFEGVKDVNTVFENGATGGTFNGKAYDAWVEGVANIDAEISSEGAAEGSDYLKVEFEVLKAGWNWVADVNWQPETGSQDVSSLTGPHLVFATKSDDITEFQFEFAFNDGTAESGTNNGTKLEIGKEWKYYALPLTDTVVWNWGSGPDWKTINRLKFGLNIDGKEVDDIFDLDLDGIGIVAAADLPKETIIIVQKAPEPDPVKEEEPAAE